MKGSASRVEAVESISPAPILCKKATESSDSLRRRVLGSSPGKRTRLFRTSATFEFSYPQWQVVVPESVNVLPATGTNLQE
jgi:hypothetical protein